ncbi:follistatin-like, partial [Anneissia japonica]|uniref:follistatin-like n=1 Tax=Anneissia japonica TaxID=1529436 RepID=UPI00142582A4
MSVLMFFSETTIYNCLSFYKGNRKLMLLTKHIVFLLILSHLILVSGVHCCDIIDYGCPKSFTLSGPVCGSDGSSYSNLCVLARRSCQTSGSKLVKVSYGTCDKTSPIIEDESRPNTNVFCVDKKHGKSCDGECKVVNNHHCCDIRNRCPNKLKKTGSVCGTDGRTYGNQCALARKSCREHGSILRMAHKGSCIKNKPP